jgi:hypothetical protein
VGRSYITIFVLVSIWFIVCGKFGGMSVERGRTDLRGHRVRFPW